MMATFIKRSVKSIRYRQYDITNDPVNIDLCQSIIKTKLKYYPDNIGAPSIQFKGCNTEWSFYSERDRDKEFEKILTKFN